MTDIVERLRAGQVVTQFDRAGGLIVFLATPSPLELEAADLIEELLARKTNAGPVPERPPIDRGQ